MKRGFTWLAQRGLEADASFGQALDAGNEAGAIGLRHRRKQFEQIALVDHAEHLARGALVDPSAAVGDRLVGQRQRIAQATLCGARDQVERAGVEADRFLAEHECEPRRDELRWNVLEVELEVDGLDLERALWTGMLPPHFLSD